MIVVERTLAVTAAAGPVLGYLTDFGNTAAWDPAVQRTARQDAGPIRPGASWLQVCRILGLTTEMVYTLVATEPGRLLFHGRNEGATCTDAVTVRPLAAGAEVTYRVELEMHGLAKLATPLMRVEFEKFGTASAVALTGALNALAGMRTAEVQFPPAPSTVLGELPT
ncbi:SRPBCC family protein [Actinoplanes sp. NPDC000266]